MLVVVVVIAAVTVIATVVIVTSYPLLRRRRPARQHRGAIGAGDLGGCRGGGSRRRSFCSEEIPLLLPRPPPLQGRPLRLPRRDALAQFLVVGERAPVCRRRALASAPSSSSPYAPGRVAEELHLDCLELEL